MTRMTWEEPPRSPRLEGMQRLRSIADELRANPGRWAVVYDGVTPQVASRRAGDIRIGSLGAFRPAGAFEATTRATAGQCRVYARYVNEKGGSES